MTIAYADKDRALCTPATMTVAPITLYVKADGNDSNPGTLALPLLTIQEAVNRIPKFVDHPVVVDIGEGSFAKFDVSNFVIGASGSIGVTGTMVTATLASGLTSGTSTGGSKTTLTKTGAGWTVDDLRGRWVKMGPTSLYLIKSNTATTLTIVGEAAVTMSGKVFVIQDNGTLLTDGIVRLSTISGAGDITSVTIQKLKLDTTAVCGISCGGVRATTYLQYLYGSCPSGSAITATFCDYLVANNCYATGNGDAFKLQNVVSAVVMNCMSYISDSNGLALLKSYAEVNDCAFYDGNNGVLQQGGECLLNTVDCSNNVENGVGLTYNTEAILISVVGTGNGSWGVYLDNCSNAQIDGGMTVTGSSGDTAVDRTTPVTWASFATIGSSSVSTSLLQRIERTM